MSAGVRGGGKKQDYNQAGEITLRVHLGERWVEYLYEVKQHQREHVIYDGHVFGESVHDPTWTMTKE